KYTWVDLGSSYLPSDFLAAFLYAQLEARDQIQLKRYNIWRYYYESFRGWVEEHGIQLPKVPEYCEQSYHMFYIILPSLSQRQALIEHLKDRSIQSVFHYLPLHLSKMGMQYGGRIGDCPVTEDLSERLLRLPFYNDLSEANQEHIVTAIKEFYE
ncbi:MAG: DegT/DnrJ/EryC1/StrS family aminotransferase, partial [bacterium]